MSLIFPNEQKKLLTELLADESGTMDDWDIKFIESLDVQLYPLTGNQTRQLKKIWQKVFN